MAGGTFTISNVRKHLGSHARLGSNKNVGRCFWVADGNANHQPTANGYDVPSIFGDNEQTNDVCPAVMGLHAIKEKPVAIDGKVEIRPVRFSSHYRTSETIQLMNSSDDVSCAYVRSSTAGWTRSRSFPCQGKSTNTV